MHAHLLHEMLKWPTLRWSHKSPTLLCRSCGVSSRQLWYQKWNSTDGRPICLWYTSTRKRWTVSIRQKQIVSSGLGSSKDDRYAVLRCEEINSRRLSTGIVEITMHTFFKSTAKEVAKEIPSPIYVAVENIFKQAINKSAANIATSSVLHRFTYSLEFSQKRVSSFMKSPTFTDPITRLVKTHSEIALMNKAKFYDQSTKTGKENKEAAPAKY